MSVPNVVHEIKQRGVELSPRYTDVELRPHYSCEELNLRYTGGSYGIEITQIRYLLTSVWNVSSYQRYRRKI